MAREIRSAARSFPVVVVTGARQVGKSTLLQQEFRDFKYCSLDDHETLVRAKTDPAVLWKDAPRVIIDEAQRAPELLSAIKLAVDRAGREIRFIISGSTNLLLMKRVGETLAGRAVYLELLPMAHGEMAGKKGRGAPDHFEVLWSSGAKIAQGEVMGGTDPVAPMLRGFMPPLMHLRKGRDALLWWEGYIKTYLERDLRQLSIVDSLIDFRRVVESLAPRTGNLMNQTEVARDTGVSQPTVHRYLKLLEVSNMISRLPSYHKSRTKRITKSSKLFFVDPALSIYLAGYHDAGALRSARELGSYFETMVFMHLRILCGLKVPQVKMYYWRSPAGKEVDFVLEHGRRVVAVEVKMAREISWSQTAGLRRFLDENPAAAAGLLVYRGTEIKRLGERVAAVPWTSIA